MSRASLNPDIFRRACGLFPTGIAVLSTCTAEGAPHGLTINSFSSISLDPPLVMVAIDRTCSFVDVFEASGAYAVNILRENQGDLSVRFAELPEGRFTGVSWRPGASGSPVIEGALCVIECRTIQLLDAGDHRVFIAEAVEVWMGEGRPLVFFNGGYAELG